MFFVIFFLNFREIVQEIIYPIVKNKHPFKVWEFLQFHLLFAWYIQVK